MEVESDDLISKNHTKEYQIRTVAKYECIKTEFFLVKVFNNLGKKKLLNMVKYNKKIKEKINININDYKECSEKYSSIEIEIKPVINKYGKFINIKKEEEIFYHIYFNNSEEEIKRNYITEDEKIKIINIKIDYQVGSFGELFSDCECIEKIYFKKFVRNNINDMSGMFYGCSSLKELNLNYFNNFHPIFEN